MHSGKAKAICHLKLPIDVATAKSLFALISFDEELAMKRRRRTRIIEVADAAEDN